MRPYDELTDQEKHDLTDEQFQYYCDLACAEAGAPLRPIDPGPRPDKYRVDPKHTFYEVCGETFVDKDEAMAVVELINKSKRRDLGYLSGPSYTRVIGDPASEVRMEIRSILTRDEAAEHKQAIEASEAAIRQWEKDKKEFDEQHAARERAIEWMVEDREAASGRIWNLERDINRFDEYLKLASGDSEVALKFYIKAYGEPTAAFCEKVGIPAPFTETVEVAAEE
ncbi:hypothetical protein LLH00_05875 [bacterium]|nr:hypothetical protein [bacterium]